ncbi:hypothetical protein QTN25_004968 [Entamoeba marina]
MSEENNTKKIDSYSILISSKYFKNEQDFINLICVNSKFRETTEKLRYNPIPITSLTLFPKIQTQYLYSEDDEKIEIDNYEICYEVTYDQYLKYKQDNIKYHNVVYTHDNMLKYGNEIPEGVNELDNCCFSFCSNLSTINLPFLLKSLGNECFCSCTSLKSVILPSKITSLGDSCFEYCTSLTSINVPSSLTFLSNSCFSECLSLKSINLPTTIQSLNNQCFYCCKSLTSINLPSKLTKIGNQCFSYCISLTTIDIPSTIQEFGNRIFSNCNYLLSELIDYSK